MSKDHLITGAVLKLKVGRWKVEQTVSTANAGLRFQKLVAVLCVSLVKVSKSLNMSKNFQKMSCLEKKFENCSKQMKRPTSLELWVSKTIFAMPLSLLSFCLPHHTIYSNSNLHRLAYCPPRQLVIFITRPLALHHMSSVVVKLTLGKVALSGTTNSFVLWKNN